MLIEQFNEAGRFFVRNREILYDVICDPKIILDVEEQDSLATELLSLVKNTFSSTSVNEQEILHTIFGIRGRGKMLILLKTNDTQRTVGFVAGHVINNGISPVYFNGEQVFHISSAHILKGVSLSATKDAILFLISKILDKPTFISAFVQSPGIYSYLERTLAGAVYPSFQRDTPNIQLSQIYASLIEIMQSDGTVENGVFKKKIQGNFYGEAKRSSNSRLNNWFYGDLGVDANNGDLLLLLGRLSYEAGD